jgi:hypothetical protein
MKLLITAVVAALVLVSGASSARDFGLRPVAHTAQTVTFSWPRQQGADGYLFLRDGVPVARTMNGSTTSATFWKGSRYAVSVLHVAKGGHVTRGESAVFVPTRATRIVRTRSVKTRLVFVPAPSPKFSLRVVDRTRKTVTFAWAPQPGADGYQFLRDGAVVARTMKSSATTATFWKGSRYAVDMLRLASDTENVVIPVRRAVAFNPWVARKARSGLVFRPAPKIDFRLRLVRQTKKTVTFSWKRQPTADGYRFLRNGIAVAQTLDRSTTSATFWKGSRYAVEVLRVAPGRRVTAVMWALAFTTTAPNARTSAKSQGGSSRGSGTDAPGSPASSAAPAKDSAPTNESPAAPKPATPAPKPAAPAPKPSTPPAPAPQPAPSPAPPAVGLGGTVTLSGSYSPSAFSQAVLVAPPGPLTVRGSFSVTGDITVDRPNLRIDGATFAGSISFSSSASGSALTNSSALGFNIFGADNVVVSGNRFDGQGRNNQNIIWDLPAGNTPDGFVIRGNDFQNFYQDGSHSEALYVGYSTNGLIEGNTFTNNGNTAHVFFTYFGTAASQGSDPYSTYPRGMCVRGNTFNATHGAYYDVMVRQPEIPSSANIKIESDASTPGDNSQFVGAC